MRPSDRQQKPRRKFDTDKADRMAADLAGDMLNWICTRYDTADDDEKLGLIIQYGPVVFELQKVIARVRRRQRRSYTGEIERKSA